MKITTPIALIILAITILVMGLTHGTSMFPLTNASARTVTVTGTADTQEMNKEASFTANVSTKNESKDVAVGQTDKKTAAIVAKLKAFGIPDSDIQTQNISVYQSEDYNKPITDNEARPLLWYANNDLFIKLKDGTRTTELATLLQQTEATNIYGPNFSAGDTKAQETELLGKAVENARSKAMIVATENGSKLGKVVNVVEGYSSTPPIYPMMLGAGGGGGGGAEASPVLPGTSTISKTVTVTFELK